MIWALFGALWWGLPALLLLGVVLAFAFGVWPLVLAAVQRIPARAQMLLLAIAVALVAGSGMYAKGHVDGLADCRKDQATAEDKADVKAAKVAAEATVKAQDITTTVTKDTADAVVQVRTIVRTLPATCPDMPGELHDALQRQVEAARAAVPPAARRPD